MDDVGWSLIALVILVGVSVFFMLNNLALRTISRVKLAEAFKAAGRDEVPPAFNGGLERLILTCSFFTLVSDVAILVLLTRLFLRHEYGYILVFLAGVVLLIGFRLTIPFSWSKYTGEWILVRTWRLLRLCSWAAWPFLATYQLHDRLVRRLAGVSDTNSGQSQEEKQEELLSFVEQGRLEGVVDEEELEMIENVLELSDTTAEEIMTPRTDLVALETHQDLPTVLRTISEAGHSRIPVYEENIDNIIGLVYAKDLLSEIGRDGGEFHLRDKIRPAYFVPESKPLRQLLHEFQNQKLHIAVVLDEYGGTAGIVTIEDILEELVGEIVDEYEETPPESMKKVDEDTIEIDARAYIDEVNDEFDLDLPDEEDYDTVGGFVFSHLGYIPKSGESFDYENLRFIIVEAEPRKITTIRIQKLASREKLNQ